MPPLLRVKDLKTHFVGFRGARVVKAVDGVSFSVNQGETLGLVGESGCGKTTTSKLIIAAEKATAGSITFDGRDIVHFQGKGLMDYRRKVQVVFQDPYSSLSPRMRVGDIIGEPIRTHERVSRGEVQSRVGELLELVGLRPDMARLFPHEFSGGQRQRIAIARALSTKARLIVLDEPVSALDVSIRAHILGLLEDIQRRLGVSYVFIGHDLAAVAHISQQIAVMYLGKIVEVSDSLELCHHPLHPYTKALFAASLPSHPDEGGRRSSWPARCPAHLTPHRVAASTPAALSPCRIAARRSPSCWKSPQGIRSPAISISLSTACMSLGIIVVVAQSSCRSGGGEIHRRGGDECFGVRWFGSSSV